MNFSSAAVRRTAPAFGAALLAGCVTNGPLAPGAADTLTLPARYDSTPYPTPRITDSLLDLFSDPALNSVVSRALANNPDLKASLARLEEAGFNTRRTYGALFPSLTGSGSAMRDATPAAAVANTFAVSLDAAWELDVWGRIRAGVTAAAADQAAAEADYKSAAQSIAAQSMQAWFDLIAAEFLVDLGERRVSSLESTRKLVARRFELGAGGLGDVELARADTENARADLQQRLDDRDRAARVVRVLIGDYPDASLSASRSWPSLDRSVPAGLPSDLLLERPDIDAAYQRIRAADARVKVAHADLFPRFNLTASGGRASDTLTNLARSSFDVWSLAANVTVPLFEAGQRRAELGAAGKRAEQAYQNWRAITLDAFREVEDALGSESYLRSQERARLTALDAARNAESKTLRDYEAGVAEVLSLLISQRLVFSTEEQTITLRLARLQNRVRLALALGKGM